MRLLIWAVFLAGAVAVRYFFGQEGRLVYLVLVLATIVLFRRQLAIGLTHVASKFGLMKATIANMPSSITLVGAAAIDEAARATSDALATAGFIDAGAWNIEQLPKIRLALMVKPADGFFAAIETASAIGVQLNVHTLYSNGNVATFTNSRLPAPGAQPPGLTRVQMPGAAPAVLLSRAGTERPRNGITPVTAAEAPRIYERLYANSIRYRKMRGV